MNLHLAQRVVALVAGVALAGGVGHAILDSESGDARNGRDHTATDTRSAQVSQTGQRGMSAPLAASEPVEPGPPGLIGLTFDDGPTELTEEILDILKEENVKATFFVQGEHVRDRPDLLRRMVAEGHVIGNHSWSHPRFTKISAKQARTEIKRTNEEIKRVTGTAPTLFRYPFGVESEGGNKAIRDLDMWGGILWHWQEGDGDFSCPGPDGVRDYVVGNAVDQALILLHDGNDVLSCPPEQIDYLKESIDTLREAGFTFGVAAPADGPSSVNENSWVKVVPAD